MMTQPIQIVQNLTSETTPAGGNASEDNFLVEDRRLIQLRARHARAEMIGESIGEVLLWFGRQFRRLRAALKEDLQLRGAEAQLYRMTDRELADLGLCRADIPFAVREATGVTPRIEAESDQVTAANQNLQRAA